MVCLFFPCCEFTHIGADTPPPTPPTLVPLSSKGGVVLYICSSLSSDVLSVAIL